MSRLGAVVQGYLHAPDPHAFTRLTHAYRNWPTVLLSRFGLRGYPVLARRRFGDELLVRKHGDVDLFSHAEARRIPEGASLHLFERELSFETEATGALCDTYFRQHYRSLPVAGASVLDLGALDGDTAVYFRLRGASRVVAVEVDPRAAVRLRSNLARNRVEGVTVLEERATRLEPYVAAMDRLAGGAGAGPLVLKMDIEGDEEPLLENSADSVVQRFHHIVLEYHRGPDRCLTRLRALGYSLHWDPPLEHPNGDRCGLIWADRDTPAS